MRTTTRRTVPGPDRVRDGRRRVDAGAVQPGRERPADDPGLVGWRRSARGAGDFDLMPVCLPGQAEINQVQAQHREEHLREALGDLKWSVAGPDGGERREGDQVPHGAAKCSEFVGELVPLLTRSSQQTPAPFCPARSRSSRRNSSGGT